jgi:hypothetical protein
LAGSHGGTTWHGPRHEVGPATGPARPCRIHWLGSHVAAPGRACDARDDLDGPGATWANVGARGGACGGALAVAPDARVQVAGFLKPALRPSAPRSVDLGMATDPSSSSKRRARPHTTWRSEATESALHTLDELAAALEERGAEFVVQGGAADGFRWLEFDALSTRSDSDTTIRVLAECGRHERSTRSTCLSRHLPSPTPPVRCAHHRELIITSEGLGYEHEPPQSAATGSKVSLPPWPTIPTRYSRQRRRKR